MHHNDPMMGDSLLHVTNAGSISIEWCTAEILVYSPRTATLCMRQLDAWLCSWDVHPHPQQCTWQLVAAL